jgi:hypothetical protein
VDTEIEEIATSVKTIFFPLFITTPLFFQYFVCSLLMS